MQFHNIICNKNKDIFLKIAVSLVGSVSLLVHLSHKCLLTNKQTKQTLQTYNKSSKHKPTINVYTRAFIVSITQCSLGVLQYRPLRNCSPLKLPSPQTKQERALFAQTTHYLFFLIVIITMVHYRIIN